MGNANTSHFHSLLSVESLLQEQSFVDVFILIPSDNAA
ncbi:hypothetical protein BN130_3441 [Cronobacter malonaticus 507]|nr:hypothetical protein BN130_3441 [Cronobacter malonaticus 507]